jgi:hypothetical protein
MEVTLYNREINEVVPANLLLDMSYSEVEQVAQEWEPWIDRAIQKLATDGVPRSQWPQHLHWNWQRKARAIEGVEGYKIIGIACEKSVQGLVLLTTKSEMCRIEAQRGKPLVYVHFLMTAPWNSRELVSTPRFSGVGQVLLAATMQLSQTYGWGGRIGLHSLPQATTFYRNVVGMTDMGEDAEAELPYFETTSEQASAFLR